MGQAATSAGRAYDILSGLAAGTATASDLGFDPSTLSGADFGTILDTLTDAVHADETTLDDAASRRAVSDAISEVMEETGVDAMSMPAEQVRDVYLRTLAYHVFDVIMRDIGGDLQKAANGNHVLFNKRCLDIRDFVRETYGERFRNLEAQGRTLSRANADAFAHEVTRSVFDVFESWYK
jgi:hypothetical protein